MESKLWAGQCLLAHVTTGYDIWSCGDTNRFLSSHRESMDFIWLGLIRDIRFITLIQSSKMSKMQLCSSATAASNRIHNTIEKSKEQAKQPPTQNRDARIIVLSFVRLAADFYYCSPNRERVRLQINILQPLASRKTSVVPTNRGKKRQNYTATD